MAHVEKRGPNRWRARYRTADSREHSRTFTRKTDAERFLVAEQAAVAQGEWIDPRRRRATVGQLGAQLLATKADPNTASWNRAMLRHVNARWENVPIGNVDHLGVQTWVTEIASILGPDTVRGAFRVLHEIVSMALRGRLIGHDPCLGVRLPKVDRRDMLFLSPAQIVALADGLETAWPGHGWGLLVRFAAYTGLRAGEIGGLRVKHLDLLRQRVHVTGALKTYGVDGDTKTGKARWVDLPRQLCDELAAHLAGRDHGPEARIWTGERGAPLSHKWFYTHRFKPIVDELSADDELPVIVDSAGEVTHTLRFHDLRHTCVALLIGKGAQQYEVMEHLGHTNIQTTINTYGHLFPSVRDRIRSALEETWLEASGA
jgi:integrase